ncbi:MAG: class I adenylate-forming enzyme family protein [Pseudomonadota bacterium]
MAVLTGDTPAELGQTGDLAISRRDPGLMLGYWGQPELTQAKFRGEWFVTGDLAAMDGEGYVTHRGRADDLMTALGYRVSPEEVEAAMAAHPEVAEIAVTEVAVRPDLTLIAGFVIPSGPWPGEESLTRHAAQHLAGYKCPKLWVEVETLPRTPNGKLKRRALAEQYRASSPLAPTPRKGGTPRAGA